MISSVLYKAKCTLQRLQIRLLFVDVDHRGTGC